MCDRNKLLIVIQDLIDRKNTEPFSYLLDENSISTLKFLVGLLEKDKGDSSYEHSLISVTVDGLLKVINTAIYKGLMSKRLNFFDLIKIINIIGNAKPLVDEKIPEDN